MQIINKKLTEIKPYENNPRINDEAVDYVANSIQEFGFKQPIVIDKNGVIIAGHTRYKASKKLHLKEVPCLVADDLTDEQVKAYRLADNKVAEQAQWDFGLLDDELNGILNIDMEDFGFRFITDEEHEEFAQETQRRVENILNLEIGQFEGEGYYDIPKLEPVYELPEIKEWIGFNYVLSDENPEGKAVHFFIDDYQFERLWNNPEKYVDKLKQYVCVATPDFSPYEDMPMACQIYNHYRKHWVGAYLQSKGVTVIPTVRSSRDTRSHKWFLEGTPEKSIIILSTMWSKSDDTEQSIDEKMIEEYLMPKKVFCYGRVKPVINTEIEMINTFASKFRNVAQEATIGQDESEIE